MAKDPYTPPGSPVSDPGPERMLAERPQQVSRAVFLLWVSYGLGIPLVYVEAQRAPDPTAAPFLVLWAVVFAFAAVLNVCISRGANWARITYLVLYGISFLVFWFGAGQMLQASVFEFLLNVVNVVIDGIALYLLFTKPGSLWYRKAAP